MDWKSPTYKKWGSHPLTQLHSSKRRQMTVSVWISIHLQDIIRNHILFLINSLKYTGNLKELPSQSNKYYQLGIFLHPIFFHQFCRCDWVRHGNVIYMKFKFIQMIVVFPGKNQIIGIEKHSRKPGEKNTGILVPWLACFNTY